MAQVDNGITNKGNCQEEVCNQCKGTIFNFEALIKTEELKLFQAMEDYYLSVGIMK